MPDPDYEARKAAARANRAFYDAFERLDLDAMRAVWLEDEGDRPVKCVHPGGELLVGLERVMASWQAIFENTDGIHFDLVDLDIDIVGELAWATNIERIRGGPEDDSPAAEAVATNLYVLRSGAWRLVLHHASPVSRRFFA